MEEFERTLHREVKAGGGTALAKRMGVNETRLLDCANPNREAHRMNLEMFGQIAKALHRIGPGWVQDPVHELRHIFDDGKLWSVHFGVRNW
ncbi:hypothetical protein FBY06_1446 [Pseudomonas sp. SJZ085]|nr:hypothetical protein FBX99_1446 [Pseudomonas sp. SJZ074]TWC30019.1 hypothetical protein FBY06_1446 [Pseudomonas sp. SJZ085]